MANEMYAVAQAQINEEIERHDLAFPSLHTDYDHLLCACAKVAPRPQVGLPDGGICFRCGGMTVRTGTCTTCTTCGETGGCG